MSHYIPKLVGVALLATLSPCLAQADSIPGGFSRQGMLRGAVTRGTPRTSSSTIALQLPSALTPTSVM